MARLYESLGAHVLDGGPTLNPSTHELLAGIHAVPSEEVVVLPNSANVIMAAERAAELAEKAVRVVASTSQQAGLAAAVALTPGADADTNAGAMRVAHRRGPHRRRGARRARRRRRALRRRRRGRLRGGRAGGLGRDRRRPWRRSSPRSRPTPSSSPASPARARRSTTPRSPRSRPVGVELELEDGGQPSYWWLLAAE